LERYAGSSFILSVQDSASYFSFSPRPAATAALQTGFTLAAGIVFGTTHSFIFLWLSLRLP
jgi:hypothetical protein